MQHRRVLYAITILMTFLWIVGIVAIGIDVFAFDKGFYQKEYKAQHTSLVTGISEEDLNMATDELLQYVKGKRDDLVIEVTVKGEQREIFNEKEKLHMIDVQNLYKGFSYVRSICFGVSTVFFIVALCKRAWRKTVVEAYVTGNHCVMLLLAGIILFAALDFNGFWTILHHIMFSNDLWYLDPQTDILINMMTGELFFHLVMKIAIFAVVILVALYILARFAKKRLQGGELLAE